MLSETGTTCGGEELSVTVTDPVKYPLLGETGVPVTMPALLAISPDGKIADE